LDGTWWKASNGSNSQLDFCTDSSGSYQTSYTNPSNTPEGYDEGSWFLYRKIATGVFYRANNNGALPGHSIWFINPDGYLANIWWAGLVDKINIKHIGDSNIHSYDIFTYSHGTTDKLCSRFSSLAGQNFDYSPYNHVLFSFEPYDRQYPANFYNVSSLPYPIYLQENSSSVLAYSFVLLMITLLYC
jgi:hypothetical protein